MICWRRNQKVWLRAQMEGGEGGDAALQLRNPGNKASRRGKWWCFIFGSDERDMSKGHSMPGNKHKHLLNEMFGWQHARGGGETWNHNCPKISCQEEIPVVDKHLLLWTACFPEEETQIYRPNYKSIKVTALSAYKYNFISSSHKVFCREVGENTAW